MKSEPALENPENECQKDFDLRNCNLANLNAHVKGETDGIQPASDLQKRENFGLIFEHRQTLPKKYSVVMCHGSRLICDHDVYDKKFNLI